MRILKYNLNLAFNTLKYIMAYGVSTLQVAPRGHSNKSPKVIHERVKESKKTATQCSPSCSTSVAEEVSVSQSPTCDEYVLYSSEVEITSQAPEPEYEVEVVSTDLTFRSATKPRNRRYGNYTRPSSHKISTINRRSRLWARQMRRRRRRMGFFGGVQRYRLRHPMPKRWNITKTPISARVDLNILKLLQNKRKQLKRDGLYQFVLWRETLKAERNRLLGSKSVFG